MTSTPDNGNHSSQKPCGKSIRFQGEPEFPHIVEIKIFLKAAEDGEMQVRSLPCEKYPEEGIMSITYRPSKKGNYHSFNYRLCIAGETELVELYDHLGAREQVLYLL